MKKYISFSAVLFLALCLSSCKLSSLKRVKVTPEPVKVSVRAVSQSVEISQRNYVGTVQPAMEAFVGTVHGGTLEKMLVSQGQMVKAGQIVATVKSPSVESSYKATQAALRQAKDGYERAAMVFANGGISELKMVELQTKLSQAESAMSAASSALDECNVRAPFDGRVSETFVHVGERVVPAQRLLSIVDADELEVSISVPEKEIPHISTGSGAVVEFPALGTERYSAAVKTKSFVSSNVSHTYSCTLKLIESPEMLLSGMVCRVYMNNDNVMGITVPADVVQVGSEGRYLWVVENGVVAKRNVVLGGYSGKGVIVTSGLEAGDFLIVGGTDKVSAGMRVRVDVVD